MLRFSLLGFPVGIHWFFWLTSFFICGGFYMTSAGQWSGVVLCMGVILLSILVHECGHALMARRFGARPSILLHGLGGVTFLHGLQVNRRQHLLVTAAGPGASLFLMVVFAGFYFWPPAHASLGSLLYYGMTVNVVWTLFNLLPILPMDGGQILRDILGPTRLRAACVTGAVVGGLMALWAFQAGWWFAGVMLVFMAIGNFRGASNLQGGVQ